MVWSHSTRASALRAKPPLRPQTMEWVQGGPESPPGTRGRSPIMARRSSRGITCTVPSGSTRVKPVGSGKLGPRCQAGVPSWAGSDWMASRVARLWAAGGPPPSAKGGGAVMGRLGLDGEPARLAVGGGGHQAKRKGGERECAFFHARGVPDSCYWRRPCAGRGLGGNREWATLSGVRRKKY